MHQGNCDGFTLGAAAAARAAAWKTPSTGVVHMFHSVRWGGWAFDVDGFTPGPPAPPTPPPPPPPGPGWGPLVDCTSCLPHDEPIKQVGKKGTLSACQAACEADSSCASTWTSNMKHLFPIFQQWQPRCGVFDIAHSLCWRPSRTGFLWWSCVRPKQRADICDFWPQAPTSTLRWNRTKTATCSRRARSRAL